MVAGSKTSRECMVAESSRWLADQEEHRLAILVRHADAVRGHGAHQAQRGIHVAFAGRPFARVVEQQREQQQGRLFHFRPQVLVRWRNVPEVLHGHQGVLVDGVAMVEIANHQALDAGSSGNRAVSTPVSCMERRASGACGEREQRFERAPQGLPPAK
jgi:hypothetical protein